MLLSGSRDKSLIIWNLTRDDQYGYPKRSLHGHSHIVSDCVCRNRHWGFDYVKLIELTRSYPLMEHTRCPLPGTKPFAFGN